MKVCFFFFSSRRRHTRSLRDWSSDVCSSDLHQAIAERVGVDVERRMDEVRDIHPEILITRTDVDRGTEAFALHAEPDFADALRGQFAVAPRSEERRVGKDCTSQW